MDQNEWCTYGVVRTPIINNVAYNLYNGKHSFLVEFTGDVGNGITYQLYLYKNGQLVTAVEQSINTNIMLGRITLTDSNYPDVAVGHQVVLCCVVSGTTLKSNTVDVLMETFSEVSVISEDSLLTINWLPPAGYTHLDQVQFTITDSTSSASYAGKSTDFGQIRINKYQTGLSLTNPWQIEIVPLITNISYGPVYETISVVPGGLSLIGEVYTNSTLYISLSDVYNGSIKVFVQENDAITGYPITLNDRSFSLLLQHPLEAARMNSIYVCKANDHFIGDRSNRLLVVTRTPHIAYVEITREQMVNVLATVQQEMVQPFAITYTLTYKDGRSQTQTKGVKEQCFFDLSGVTIDDNLLTISAMQVHDTSSGPVATVSYCPKASSFTRVEYDKGVLSLNWQDIGMDSYRIYLNRFDGQQIVYNVKGTQAQINNPFLPASVSVQGVKGLLAGAFSPVYMIHDDTIVIQKVELNGNTATCTWAPVGQFSYQYRYAEGDWVSTNTAQCSFTIDPSNLSSFEVRIIDSSGIGLGPITTVPIENLVLTKTDFDGHIAEISWNPLSSGNVMYLLTIRSSSGVGNVAQPLQANEAILSILLTNTTYRQELTDGNYEVTVQAIYKDSNGNSNGGVVTVAQTLLSAGYFFAEGTQMPQLYFDDQIASSTGIITVPLGVQGDLADIQNDSFSLKKDVATGVYTLTIVQSDQIPSADTRAKIKNDYIGFLNKMETNQVEPYDFTMVQDCIGRLLPQCYEDCLFYGLGYREEDGAVDLRPGMVLRVEYESDQNCTSTTGDFKSGYQTNAVAEYEVIGNSREDSNLPHYYLGLDAFLTRVSLQSIIVSEPEKGTSNNTQSGYAGGVDLGYAGMHRAFYRLVLPTDLFLPNEDGESRLPYYMSLLAADKYSKLDTATTLLRCSGTITDTEVGAGYFMGRTIVTPCIRIKVNGIQRVVPVGTRLEHVLNGEGLLFSKTATTIGKSLQVTRRISCMQVNQNHYAACQLPICILHGTSGLYDNYETRLSMPLLSGDEITIW